MTSGSRCSGLCAAIAIALVFLAAAVPARAQDESFGFHGWGPQIGLSVDPDQFFFGAHFDLGEFAPNLRFQPNVDLGFGDDITLLAINPDVAYYFPVEGVGALYVGGLLALQWYKYDRPAPFDDTDTELGLHLLGGLTLEPATPVYFELKVGLDDTPDLKALAGYTFRY
ncbi:MAG: hypothetical protein ACE15D_15415 [Candidatus Eisenbacteria bacterium]|nr:hypothetical protein [Candidatus Eisenbacteria bacterium]